MTLGPWTTADFETLSWHDVQVYGFALENFREDHGSADLKLDIDFILDSLRQGHIGLFEMCRAELVFHGASNLKVRLDYAGATAGMCPFSIAEIERTVLEYPNGYKSFHWRIPINWPGGEIEFDAIGFTQRLTATPNTLRELSPD